MKAPPAVRCGLFALAVLAIGAGAADDTTAYVAQSDAEGVQHAAIVGGSYFFRPHRIVARAGRPLELRVKREAGIVPHSFVLEAPDGKQLVDVDLGEEATAVSLNLAAGDYLFYCPNRLLFFKSHRERGMAGVLEVRE